MYRVKRIAQAVKLWKDCIFSLKINTTGAAKFIKEVEQEYKNANFKTNVGPFVHADNFEQNVLGKTEFTLEDWNNYCFNFFGELGKDLTLNDLNSLPFNVWKWSSNSRRVFHISKELQMFLDATELGDTNWADVVFPFNSFFVSFEEPIIGERYQYDGVLVNIYKTSEIAIIDELITLGGEIKEELTHGRVLDITLFPTALGAFNLLSDSEKSGFKKALKNRRDHQLAKLWYANLNKTMRRPHVGRLMLYIDELSDLPISASIEELLENDLMHEAFGNDGEESAVFKAFSRASRQEALKLVLGLCIYLQCQNSEDASVAKRTYPMRRTLSLDQKVIADSCNFYDVVLDYEVLTDEEKGLLGSDKETRRKYREMGFHWRRAHMRFAPGMRTVPGAKKTVKVRACRVRPDRQPKGTVAGGTRQVLIV